jgi:hypothetical protein
MSDKPVSTNPLGQFRDEVVDVVSDTAKAVVSEPAKILEQILGGKAAGGNGDKGIEDIGVTAGSGSNDPQQQQTIMMKQMADRQKSNALLALHRQRLEEEKAYVAKSQQEEEVEEQKKEQASAQEKQNEIIQLQREEVKSEQLQGQTHGRMGSHEQGDKHKG